MIVVHKSRRGITLTEILIAIMILGVGLVSLATLFPIGLLRLRDAARFSRTKYLTDAAGADGSARSLLSSSSFGYVDLLNFNYGLPLWYPPSLNAPTPGQATLNPLVQDTPGYGQDFWQLVGGVSVQVGANSGNSGGYGLPFAYDPLWRFQTFSNKNGSNGYYLGDVFEARFGSGIGYIRDDPTGGLPSAHGLQRLSNFNHPDIMPISYVVPSIFVSPEDVVWVEALASNSFSPVLPDLDPNRLNSPGVPVSDWHYSWCFTGYQVSSSGGSTFEGNIVIFENRPFAINAAAPPGPGLPETQYSVDGETVVEAIWGHSGNVQGGYATGADRTVLLRWYSTQADPIVKPGDWIADVTYERNALTVWNSQTGVGRFLNGTPVGIGVQNPFHNGEWDNLPAQRCFWYQVQKVTPAIDDPYTANVPVLRSMVVYVDRSLEARTVLTAVGTPAVYNAALIAPSVVNVIPQQFSTRP
jgi:Prokaryotic N-terminal methylation motif